MLVCFSPVIKDSRVLTMIRARADKLPEAPPAAEQHAPEISQITRKNTFFALRWKNLQCGQCGFKVVF